MQITRLATLVAALASLGAAAPVPEPNRPVTVIDSTVYRWDPDRSITGTDSTVYRRESNQSLTGADRLVYRSGTDSKYEGFPEWDPPRA